MVANFFLLSNLYSRYLIHSAYAEDLPDFQAIHLMRFSYFVMQLIWYMGFIMLLMYFSAVVTN